MARRLAQLSAELEAAREESVKPASGGGWWNDPTRGISPDQRVVSTPTHSSADPAPPLVPVPGRHAAPRRATRLVDVVVPATLRGRVLLGPGPLTVVALVVALGMGATAWTVVRGDPAQPVVAMAAPTAGGQVVALPSTEPSAGRASGVPAGQTGSVTVDVAGKVRRPGIAVLDQGARVVDALKAAGGARHGVDLSSLNLARVLADGEQILVGVAAAESAAIPGQDGSTSAPGQLVNLNVATVSELESLPEVGPVTAAAIIAWREANGGFSAVDELLEIDGIGETTLGQIAPFVTI